jgi:predicted site-specific integrase-resolvase
MPRSTANLIGSAELCEVVGIDRSTLSRWVQVGKITPAMKLPGKRGAMLWPTKAIEQARQLKDSGESTS